MNTQSTLQKLLEDRVVHSRDFAKHISWLTRLLLRVFARRLNREVFNPIIARAHERGIINSHQLHELLVDFDPTQQGAVGLAIQSDK